MTSPLRLSKTLLLFGMLNLQVFGVHAEEITKLETLVVEELIDAPIITSKSETETVYGIDELESRNKSDVYKIIESTPGVLIESGPRASGSRVNIRGFSDNEDVRITLDGAVKNFEKYRYGSGFQVDPELLKSVKVRRGAPSLTDGTGTLGGAIEMETKDARDFLKPDESFGGYYKTAFRSNNREWLNSISLYGAPNESVDLLLNITDRDGSDIKLSNGERLDQSEENPESLLAKAEFYIQDMIIWGVNYSQSRREGLELFDTTSFESGFRTVQRDYKDQSISTNFNFVPESDYIDLTVALAYTDVDLKEEDVEGANSESDFDYDIYSATLRNIAEISDQWTLTVGADVLKERRQINSDNVNTTGNSPSGDTVTGGAYIQNEFGFEEWTFIPTIRYDYHEVKSNSDSTNQLLDENDLPSVISEETPLFSLNVEYAPIGSSFTYFANYREARRYPKIDEYFTDSLFGECVFLAPGATDFLPGLHELPEPYNSAGVCADLYQPEENIVYELGISTEQLSLFDTSHRVQSRLTAFYNKTDKVLESIRDDPSAPDEQVGEEWRRGIEIELNYLASEWVLFATYAHTSAREYSHFEDEIRGVSAERIEENRRIYNVPGNTYTLGIRYHLLDDSLVLGARARYVRSYLAKESEENVLLEDPVVRQDDYTIVDVNLSYQPTDWLKLALGVDNLTNDKYKIDTGFGLVENLNSGRDIKSSITVFF